ncbi:putative glycolipid-binding domain-containing protein [Acrocarpospora sp. B8E8]|uniref:putative glycolipid-binding domain-containing protein n=1 Tax=Acrocarpospora sp. B8E8 TaxID=3153572 RepID=UPI00325F24C1
MSFVLPPDTAAWLHQEARAGFEVAYFEALDDGWRAQGWTTAVEEGETWVVRYDIRLDEAWTTRSAEVWGQSVSGERSTVVEADSAGHWLVNGQAALHLDGCLDVDLESSAMTNAFPVHRMALPVGARAEAPAAYVRAVGLGVERLEQSYERLTNKDTRQRYDYAAPIFNFACHLVYDESGLVLDYPGIATRAQ